jgi:hypothetical protein
MSLPSHAPISSCSNYLSNQNMHGKCVCLREGGYIPTIQHVSTRNLSVFVASCARYANLDDFSMT